MTGPREQTYALAGHCRSKDANLWAHPEKKSLDRLWRVFPRANLLPLQDRAWYRLRKALPLLDHGHLGRW
jgi:hypothetical protein